MIRDLKQATELLEEYVPLARQITGKDITLERMLPLMERVGSPEKRLKIVHVAGTSGKTSTCYYTAALIRATGASVGLTVSPHVDSLLERFQINGELLSEIDFCRYLSEFMGMVGDMQPTYFELLIAFAYWVFDKLGVDYAVVETGLGGLQDSTNIAARPDKVCVVTDIGYDHMHVLGKTLPEIAAQKAGIIHHGNQVFMYTQAAEIMKVLTGWTCDQAAVLNELSPEYLAGKFKIYWDEMPLFQRRNWLLAREVVEYLLMRDKFGKINEQDLATTQRIKIPGRMDELMVGDKMLIMDGAHNNQKMAAFIDSFVAKYPGQKAAVMLSMKDKKDFSGIADLVLPVASRLILTTFKVTQDRPHISTNLQELKQHCRQAGFSDVEVIEDLHEAYNELLKSQDKLLIVTGSFYLLQQLRNQEHLV